MMDLQELLGPRWMDKATDGLYRGTELSLVTLFLTIGLEVLSLPTVRDLLGKQKNGCWLYTTGWLVNVWNHFGLGIPVYISAAAWFTSERHDPWSIMATRIAALLLIHAVCYYSAHKVMHTPSYYRYHRFHHRYKQYIPPSAANAVSVVEYLVAYVLPFLLASVVVRPTELELRTSVYLVSIANLLIHTPAFKSVQLPKILVSAVSHGNHHRRLTTDFAAPILNIDWILEQLGSTKTVN